MLKFYLFVVVRDWRDWILKTAKLIAYLARYGKQQIDRMEDWPLSKLYTYTALVGEIVNRENKTGS